MALNKEKVNQFVAFPVPKEILGGQKLDQDFLSIKKIPRLKKGDIVIVKMKEDINAPLAEFLIKKLTETFPDNKSIVLCKGRDLYPLPGKILNDMGWYKRKKKK